MSSTTQRKRRGAAPSTSRRTAKSTRVAASMPTTTTAASVPTTTASSVPTTTAVTQTIAVLDTTMPSGEEEVVDLTCEGSEPAVVDLTNNDSVEVVDEGPQGRRGPSSESYVLSSDEEDDTHAGLTPALLSSLQANSKARSTPGAISCPVCMDTYAEIIESGRLVVSTKCGHVFCSQCLRDSLTRSHTCPTCRKKLTHKQYHPIYI